MDTHYGELRELRSQVVPDFPPLLAIGQRILTEISLEGSRNPDPQISERAAMLNSEIAAWSEWGQSFTSAHDILASESKFRVFLWSICTIRDWRASGYLELDGVRYERDVLIAAERLVHDLNAFLFHYEAGNYPARQTLGLLHRSLAGVSKSTEVLVWERSLVARWGRRVLRIGLAAQGYNDVTPIHMISDLFWTVRDGTSYLIHPRRKTLLLGTAVFQTSIPDTPKILPRLRLWLRTVYWATVGRFSPTPRFSIFSFGGWRLHLHRKDENRLAGLFQFAGDSGVTAFDFSWGLTSLIVDQQRKIGEMRNQVG